MVEMIDGPLFLLCTYSLSLLLLQENGHDEICIKAMGRAINKTVMVVELIKVG
jgi:DNA-binding protein Alba